MFTSCNWGEPERAPHRWYKWEISYTYVLWYDRHPRATVGCMKYVGVPWPQENQNWLPWPQEEVDILPGKSDSFGVSLAFVVHSTNSTKDQRVSSLLTSELAVDEREKASMQAGEGEGTPWLWDSGTKGGTCRAARWEWKLTSLARTDCCSLQILWLSLSCSHLASGVSWVTQSPVAQGSLVCSRQTSPWSGVSWVSLVCCTMQYTWQALQEATLDLAYCLLSLALQCPAFV